MASTPYRISPAGIAQWPWVNAPDTKFNAEGVFKTGLILEGEEAQSYKVKIDAEADAAFAEGTKDMTPAEAKKWTVYRPYEVEEDDEGRPTGRIIFQYRQNAVIKVEGEPKQIRIALFDADDKPTAVKVFGGATIRIAYKPRAIKLASAKQWGVRLDFLKVQVLKLPERDGFGSTGGFGAVEGGFVEEHHHDKDESFAGSASATGTPGSADY